jgi:hypothetical protein
VPIDLIEGNSTPFSVDDYYLTNGYEKSKNVEKPVLLKLLIIL